MPYVPDYSIFYEKSAGSPLLTEGDYYNLFVLSIHLPDGGTGPTRRRGAPVTGAEVTREFDKASPKLQEAILKGDTFAAVRLTMPGSSDMILHNVTFTNYSFHASGNDEAGPPTETITLDFEEITWGENVTNTTNTTNLTAPFTVTIEPDYAKIKKGENVKYLVVIDADEGFNELVQLEMDLDIPLGDQHYIIDTYGPDYPVRLNYTLIVPSNLPFGFVAHGTIIGISEPYQATDDFIVVVEGPAMGVGKFLNGIDRFFEGLFG